MELTNCSALHHNPDGIVTMHTPEGRSVEVCKRCMVTIGDFEGVPKLETRHDVYRDTLQIPDRFHFLLG